MGWNEGNFPSPILVFFGVNLTLIPVIQLQSTISKVLRQKERFLGREHTSAPAKRTTGHPNVARALSNWVRKRQRPDQPLGIETIRERALLFARTWANHCDDCEEESRSWLKGFKNATDFQHFISQERFATTKNGSESPKVLCIDSTIESAVRTPRAPSAISSIASTPPWPLVPMLVQGHVSSDSIYNLPSDSQCEQTSDIPVDAMSPFSPSQTSLISMPATDSYFSPASRASDSYTWSTPSTHRSLTIVSRQMDPSMLSPIEQCDQLPPMAALPQTRFQESLVIGEHGAPAISDFDATCITAQYNREGQEVRAKYPPLFLRPATVSPMKPLSGPTQDEARRALDLVIRYFDHRPGDLKPQESLLIGSLMEILNAGES